MKGTPLRLFILFFCTAGSLLILQSAFDSSDHGKAERAVRNYKIGERQLGLYVETRSPGGVWTTEITQGCRGIVRTRYDVGAAHYEFDYDVPGHMIHPANEAGKHALESFAITDGGAPHD